MSEAKEEYLVIRSKLDSVTYFKNKLQKEKYLTPALKQRLQKLNRDYKNNVEIVKNLERLITRAEEGQLSLQNEIKELEDLIKQIKSFIAEQESKL